MSLLATRRKTFAVYISSKQFSRLVVWYDLDNIIYGFTKILVRSKRIIKTSVNLPSRTPETPAKNPRNLSSSVSIVIHFLYFHLAPELPLPISLRRNRPWKLINTRRVLLNIIQRRVRTRHKRFKCKTLFFFFFFFQLLFTVRSTEIHVAKRRRCHWRHIHEPEMFRPR